jgi:hypothetical protein
MKKCKKCFNVMKPFTCKICGKVIYICLVCDMVDHGTKQAKNIKKSTAKFIQLGI